MRLRVLPVALLAAAAFSQDNPPSTPQPLPSPSFTGELSLVRYDMPLGFSDGFAPTHQLAVQKDGEEAVEWPDFTLNGAPIFRKGAQESLPFRLRRGSEARPLFQQPGDEVIQPGEHWFRPIEAGGNRKHLYTADKTARCDNTGIDPRGRWELWLFPLQLSGEGGPNVKNVVLREAAGGLVFRKNGPWRSLTLLLPANAPGRPYELTVDGRGPLKIEVGLKPAKPGNPVAHTFEVETKVPGEGPKIRVFTPARPEVFPHQREWDADVAAMSRVMPESKPASSSTAALFRDSPVIFYAAALPHGMSGGFWKKGTNADEYAERLAAAGFDTVFDPVAALPNPSDAESIETRAAELARHGIRMGLQYDQNWTRPSLQHPNLALLAHTLPEWHQPLYRSLQLTAQRFNRIPGFAGIMIGGENAAYASTWSSTAPPTPNRPWAEAMIELTGSSSPWMARLPGEKGAGVPNVADFIKYIDRYDAAFHQYGYFAEAVRAVNPRMAFTTSSFGSSPGAGARGGWPWGSVPGRIMFEGLPVQQAYDWNELHSSKPMHLVALVDRLRSYWPKTPTWALVDNAKLFFGRDGWQRATALALTRGVRGIGTNFIAASGGESARPDLVAAQREMADWIHKYGPVFAASEPEATIGVFFGFDQAILRPVNIDPAAPLEQLLRGSHEGKVTEALWLCHAAGFPARVVTYQELMRGALPISMKALLLVGLERPDDTWFWAKGLEPALQQFLNRGGRILAAPDSECPVPTYSVDLQVAAYVTQSELDPTPRLLERNKTNIEQLRAALSDVTAPIATSDDPTLWVIPTRVKDVLYVTVLNWAYADGDEAKEFVRVPDPRATRPEVWKTKANASLYVKPRKGTIRWNTSRPIYSLREGRLLSSEEASTVDFSRDAFQWYALPPNEPKEASAISERGRVGLEIKGADGIPIRGLPVSINLAALDGDDHFMTTALSGELVDVPKDAFDAKLYSFKASNLLTGVDHAFTLPGSPRTAANRSSPVGKFIDRKLNPVVIALTPSQLKDPAMEKLAQDLTNRFRQKGRIVRVGIVSPKDVVESLQPLKSPHRFPQWKSIPADLVLFGTPRDNVLMLDQLRGEIFPSDFQIPPAGQGRVFVTKSAFVGECDVLNVVALDAAGATAALAE
jgi:hypothetical protein